MIKSDSTKIEFRWDLMNDRARSELIRKYKDWFIEHNIKYSFESYPAWWTYPTSVILRNEDALLFKLTFGL